MDIPEVSDAEWKAELAFAVAHFVQSCFGEILIKKMIKHWPFHYACFTSTLNNSNFKIDKIHTEQN